MAPKAPVGYDDTPMLPRLAVARPRLATTAAERRDRRDSGSVEKSGRPPSDAVVLFDGSNLSRWTGREGEAKWKVENGYMEVTRTGDIETREHFGDCQLHLEFATPAEVKGDSQGRGNSGVFLMGRYEIQVLDGYNNLTYADGITASIYGQFPPLVNACRLPGEWQSYDIFFVAPRFEGERLLSPAYITVVHNGVLVHNHQAALGPTGHKNLSSYDRPHAAEGPLKLQDHGNPVRYRNIWMRRIKGYDQP